MTSAKRFLISQPSVRTAQGVFLDSDLFEQIFYRILREATKYGLVDPSVAFIDSTNVKANANKKKFNKKIVRVETRSYQNKLEEVILTVRHTEKSTNPSNKRKRLK